MRPIQNKDLFRFIRMIKDAGISAEFKKLILSKDSIQDFTVESMGLEVMYMFAEGVADEDIEQNQLYPFLADLIGTSAEEVAEMDPIDTLAQLKDCASWEKWKAFFTLAAKSMK